MPQSSRVAQRFKRWMHHLRLLVLRTLMLVSPVPVLGYCSIRLAECLVGPYKDRRILAHVTSQPYISTRAQIKCSLLVGRSCFIDDGVTIYSHGDGGKVQLGDRVHLYRGTIIEVGAGGSVIIGSDTHVQAACHLKGFLSNVVIGSNVQIAPHCGFSPYEHNFDDKTAPIQGQGIRSAGDILLEDDVWLGLGVTVLEGVTIGHGAVIGAGAVVTKSIPPLAVAVGVPATVLRLRGDVPRAS